MVKIGNIVNSVKTEAKKIKKKSAPELKKIEQEITQGLKDIDLDKAVKGSKDLFKTAIDEFEKLIKSLRGDPKTKQVFKDVTKQIRKLEKAFKHEKAKHPELLAKIKYVRVEIAKIEKNYVSPGIEKVKPKLISVLKMMKNKLSSLEKDIKDSMKTDIKA